MTISFHISASRDPVFHVILGLIVQKVELRVILFANHQVLAGYGVRLPSCSRPVITWLHRLLPSQWDTVYYMCKWAMVAFIGLLCSTSVLGVMQLGTGFTKPDQQPYYRRGWDFAGMLEGNLRALLRDTIQKMVRLATNKSTRNWNRVLWAFVHRLYRLYRAQGAPGVVLHLKVSQLLLMQAAAGHKTPNPRLLGCAVSRTRSGLPRLIPILHRNRIRAGDLQLLRTWLSLLSLFRVITYPGTLKLSTITASSLLNSRRLLDDFLQTFWWRLHDLINRRNSLVDYVCKDFSREYLSWKSSRSLFRQKGDFVTSWATKYLKASPYKIMKKSSVTSFASTTPHAILMSAWLLFRNSYPVWLAMTDWLRLTKNDAFAEFMLLSERTADYLLTEAQKLTWLREGFLGRLSVKEEPAGKLRVFAIVDCWTQWMFRPLHTAICGILRLIPQDGTFDQRAPITKLIERVGKNKESYSYDLSAATDRLPVIIQGVILSYVLGPTLAAAWESILIRREYKLPNPKAYSHAKPSKAKAIEGYAIDRVTYAVGQPMGALSSWAMLALTHHVIVQFSAWKCNHKKWFKDYAVLGDDIVICDSEVASTYLDIMTNRLGVGINVHKSLVSERTSLEFAKKYYRLGKDLTPYSFKELSAAQKDISVWRQLGDKYGVSHATLLNLMGLKPNIARLLSKPIDSIENRFVTKREILFGSLRELEFKTKGYFPSAFRQVALDTKASLEAKFQAWNSREMDLPSVSLLASPTRRGLDWTSSRATKDTFVVGPGISMIDLLSLIKGGTPWKNERKLGWIDQANQILYSKDMLYTLTDIQNNISQIDALLQESRGPNPNWERLLQILIDLQHTADMIPKDLESGYTLVEKRELPLRNQIRRLRQWMKYSFARTLVL